MNEPTTTNVFFKNLMFVKFYVIVTCNVHEIVYNYKPSLVVHNVAKP